MLNYTVTAGGATRSMRPPASMQAAEPLLRWFRSPSTQPAPMAAPARRLHRTAMQARGMSPQKGLVTSLVSQSPLERRRRSLHLSAAVEAEVVSEAESKPVALPTSDEDPELLRIRHTTAHVMAMAVQKLFKGEAKCTIGPWIERGFYYDFAYEKGFTDRDLKRIKKEMIKIINRKLPLVEEKVSVEEARRRIEAAEEPYKLEILEDIVSRGGGEEVPITIYHVGDPSHEKGSAWWDLCAGPHVASTGDLNPKGIELESVAGAYWRGDESRAMLQRIYGTAWATAEQLEAYQAMKAEAARRDHRRLGKDLDLFSLQESTGGGLVFWHPKGARIRHIIETFWKELHLARGYELLYTPHVGKLDLWKTSGHHDFYGENMFDSMLVEDETYQLRPMNCPFHVVTYQDGFYSYKDLPLRWAELGTVYRYERSGTMHGLFRVRGFTQDDAHVFCLPDQVSGEILRVLDLTEEILSTFGFTDYEVNLSTRPEKSVGSDAIWEKAEASIKEALGMKGWDYVVDEGGGAFYGPKIDLKIKDAIGRSWQCSTVQVDFNLPERFDMVYVDKDQERRRPIMIHRAIFGSLERFFGILVENYAGDFPLWLAPVQARLIPVSPAQEEYAQAAAARMRAGGVRVEVATGQRLGKAIRNAEVAKVPLVAVVGDREIESDSLSLRSRQKGELEPLSVEAAIQQIQEAVDAKAITITQPPLPPKEDS